jgi:transposase-like protein
LAICVERRGFGYKNMKQEEIKEKIIKILLKELTPRKIELPAKYLNLVNGQDKYMSDIANNILKKVHHFEKQKLIKYKKHGSNKDRR